MMGMSFGLFWANRDFPGVVHDQRLQSQLLLRVETFFYTNTYVIVPVIIGWFIEGTGVRGWFGGTATRLIKSSRGLSSC